MNIIEHAVKRPVAVAMMCLAVLMTGLFALSRLPLALTPDVTFPRLYIHTIWPDTAPEIIEAFATSPIEAAANTVANVENISSESSEGRSRVTVEFSQDADMDFAALELGERLAQISETLPSGAQRPVIEKYVPQDFRQETFFSIRVTGPFDLQDLRRIGQREIKPALTGIKGVANVEVTGGQDRQLQILLDKQRLQAFGLAEFQIGHSLRELGYRQSIGAVTEGARRMTLFIDTPLESAREIENLIITSRAGALIRLSDIAEIRDTRANPVSISRVNGNPAVLVSVEKEAAGNSIEVADHILSSIDLLSKKLPAGIVMTVLTDQSREIRQELSNVSMRALFSVVVIFLVLLTFLHTFRMPLIILSTIFFSVLFTMNLFLLFGISLNLLTLAGLALGFGILVDNAIVVVENISRYKTLEANIKTAAILGSTEVALPIIAATLTTLAAFIPMLYLTGENRLYFVPFTMAVGFALLSSLAVSFTLTPALSCRLMKPAAVMNPEKKEFAPLALYRSFLKIILRHRGIVLLIALFLLAGSGYLFNKHVTRGRIWGGRGRQDQISVSVRLPKGAPLERFDEIIQKFEDTAIDAPGVRNVITTVSRQSAGMTVLFNRAALKTARPYLLKENLAQIAAHMAGVGGGIFGFGDPVIMPGMLGGGFGGNRIEILGYNYQKVKEIAESLGQRLSTHPRVAEINTDASYFWGSTDQQEVVLRIKRDKLARYSINPQQLLGIVGRHLNETLTRDAIKLDNEQVDYVIRFADVEHFSIQDLNNMLVPVPGGETVRLNELAYIAARQTMGVINRHNQQYQRYVSFEFRGPWKMARNYMDQIIETTHLPPGYTVQAPKWRLTEQETMELYLVIGISLVLVFMVTAGLFESLLHPFLILLTVPLALTGVFLIFYLTGTNFDRSAYIGLALLCGIVVNDSILLVDHINLERRKGLSVPDAAVKAAADRVRPILMTTFTTIGGLLPLVLFAKAEGNIWYALSLSTIGGLIASTLMTLTVIPALYISLEKGLIRIRNLFSE